jgi:arginase
MEYYADTRMLTSMEVMELNPFMDHGNDSAERTLELITSALGKSIL